MPVLEHRCFMLFTLLYLAFALFHLIQLQVRKWRKTDPTNTRFWGKSWLGRLSPLQNLTNATGQGKLEPFLVFLTGYVFCAFAPLFGLFLMAGGVAFWLDEAADWKGVRERELDARDAITYAQTSQADYEAAIEHQEREQLAEQQRVSDKTLARIQRNPHALLALSPEETRAACAALGSERFGELCDQLPPEAQNEVYGRMPGLEAAS